MHRWFYCNAKNNAVFYNGLQEGHRMMLKRLMMYCDIATSGEEALMMLEDAKEKGGSIPVWIMNEIEWLVRYCDCGSDYEGNDRRGVHFDDKKGFSTVCDSSSDSISIQ